MDITVYDSTQKQLIGYNVKCGMADLSCFLGDKHADFVKGDHSVHIDYDKIIRIDGNHFIIKNSNVTLWVRTSKYLPVGVFGDVKGIIR